MKGGFECVWIGLIFVRIYEKFGWFIMSGNENQLALVLNSMSRAILTLSEKQENIQNTIVAFSNILIDMNNQVVQSRKFIQALSASQKKSSPQKIRCVFIIQLIEQWDALFPLYKEMLRNDYFDPIVVTLDRHLGGDGYFCGEQRVSDELMRLNIPHLRFDMEDSFAALEILRDLAPDIVFRQSQWDNLYPPAFSSEYLSFSRICVVPYGVIILEKYSTSGDEEEKPNALSCDTPYHRRAWRIFCETEYALEKFQSFQHSVPGKLVLSGYPKFQSLLDEAPAWPFPDRQQSGHRPFRVIWSPHHSVKDAWLNFGTFNEIYENFLEWAASSPDMEFVFKPHPELLKSVVNRRIMTQEQVDHFMKKWLSLENCTCADGRYGGLFSASDIMITDGISFLVEYPIFGKPLVFFDSGRHAPLNDIGRLAKSCAHVVHDFSSMKTIVSSYKNGTLQDPYAENRKKLMKVLFPFEKRAEEIIIENIVSSFKP